MSGVTNSHQNGLISAEEFKAMKESEVNGVFERLQDEQKTDFEKAKEENDFWDILYSDLERFQADTNNNDIIEYEEYKQFIQNKANPSTVPYQPNKFEYSYSIDLSVLIAIGMVCLTAIIITIIRRK